MAQSLGEKIELASVNVSEQNVGPDETTSVLEKQTRTRRLFSAAQLFGFSLMSLGTWGGVGGSMYFALYNGGPRAWFFSYIIVFLGVLAQAASLAEMASIQPVAGAQYHWTWHFAPPSIRRFVTWIQGWSTWIGYVALLASILNSGVVSLEATIQLNNPDYVPGGWHTTMIVICMVTFMALMNIYAFRIIPWLEFVAGILNVCLFLVYVVVLFVMSPRNSSDFILTTNMSSGWDNYFVSWNVGSLSHIFLFVGFESVIHMGEETKQAKRAVPKAMFYSVCTSGVLAFVMLITLIVCMGPLEEVLNSASPFVTLLYTSTGSPKAATAMISALVASGIGCSLATVSSVSRLTWAWARDGGLPQYFAYVSAKHRVPVRAVLLTVGIVAIFSLLNIGSTTYIVFGAIVSLSSFAMYVSYALVLMCMLYARWHNNVQLGEWNLGRWGLYINSLGLLYTLWALIFLVFPMTLPVDALTMNYSGPVYGVVLLVAITLWFSHAQKHWEGPNRDIINIILRNS